VEVLQQQRVLRRSAATADASKLACLFFAFWFVKSRGMLAASIVTALHSNALLLRCSLKDVHQGVKTTAADNR
jgi:hypothetical protein